MEIIFTEFIFAYSLAECHKKVATIIFYFASAVSHATVERDRLCFFLVSALPAPSPSPLPLSSSSDKILPHPEGEGGGTVAGKLTTPEAGTQKVGGKIRISGRIRTLYSQSDFRGKN